MWWEKDLTIKSCKDGDRGHEQWGASRTQKRQGQEFSPKPPEGQTVQGVVVRLVLF